MTFPSSFLILLLSSSLQSYGMQGDKQHDINLESPMSFKKNLKIKESTNDTEKKEGNKSPASPASNEKEGIKTKSEGAKSIRQTVSSLPTFGPTSSKGSEIKNEDAEKIRNRLKELESDNENYRKHQKTLSSEIEYLEEKIKRKEKKEEELEEEIKNNKLIYQKDFELLGHERAALSKQLEESQKEYDDHQKYHVLIQNDLAKLQEYHRINDPKLKDLIALEKDVEYLREYKKIRSPQLHKIIAEKDAEIEFLRNSLSAKIDGLTKIVEPTIGRLDSFAKMGEPTLQRLSERLKTKAEIKLAQEAEEKRKKQEQLEKEEKWRLVQIEHDKKQKLKEEKDAAEKMIKNLNRIIYLTNNIGMSKGRMFTWKSKEQEPISDISEIKKLENELEELKIKHPNLKDSLPLESQEEIKELEDKIKDQRERLEELNNQLETMKDEIETRHGIFQRTNWHPSWHEAPPYFKNEIIDHWNKKGRTWDKDWLKNDNAFVSAVNAYRKEKIDPLIESEIIMKESKE